MRPEPFLKSGGPIPVMMLRFVKSTLLKPFWTTHMGKNDGEQFRPLTALGSDTCIRALFNGGRKGDKRGLSSTRAQQRASAALRPCNRRAATTTRRNAVRLAALRRLRQDAQRFASPPSAARGAARARARARAQSARLGGGDGGGWAMHARLPVIGALRDELLWVSDATRGSPRCSPPRAARARARRTCAARLRRRRRGRTGDARASST